MALLKPASHSAVRRALPLVEWFALAVSFAVAAILLAWTLYRG